MRQPQVDDRVRLTCGIPDLSLNRGDVGLVRSIWFAPDVAFEVEIRDPGSCGEIRTLVLPRQIESLDSTDLHEDKTELAARWRVQCVHADASPTIAAKTGRFEFTIGR